MVQIPGRDTMSSSRAATSASAKDDVQRAGWARWEVLVICVMLATGCSGIPVNIDFDPSVSFSEFNSYAFLPSQPQQAQDPRLHNSLIDGRVRRAVNRQLAARGFDEVPIESAEFLVVHHLALETRLDVQTIHTSHRYSQRGWSAPTASRTTVREYERGTLMIDFLMPTDRSLVWRGSASARIRQTSDPTRGERRISEAVERILDRFPPK